MRIDIWSDVRCPFCYIGKKKFEKALENFAHKSEVEVVWKSFQLDPQLKTQTGTTTIEYFMQTKNISENQTRQMFSHAQNMATDEGLNLDLENSIVANSFNAHRLIQFSKTKNLASEIEEALFQAHFSEMKNIDDLETLLELGVSAGLEKEELKKILFSDEFSYEVKQDEMEAQNIGVSGVPFFVFDGKYAVSGAQPTSTFLEILEKTWNEENKN
ncbi:MAG TPA: DsbA family oxidoreductase [Salinimicrobium sp.]|nr:DsbA family oxidoreductase [Salinimicrobium sp.]